MGLRAALIISDPSPLRPHHIEASPSDMKTSDRSLARGEQPCCGWRWSNACWKKINSATKEGTFWLYDGCSQSIFSVQAAGAANW